MAKPKVVKLKTELPDDEVDSLAGTFLDDSHYDVLVEGDCDVYTPDGEPLIVYRRDVIPAAACRAAHGPLREASKDAQGNRGLAAGPPKEMKIANRPAVAAGPGSKVRLRPIKTDGTLSNTSYAQAVNSSVIGFMDRYARFPYCRTTAFTMEHPDLFAKVMPFIRAVDAAFAKYMPDRYAAQKAVVDATSKDFVIPGTTFTTITVNFNWRTAAHKDAGDLKAGFGVMSVLRAGEYRGGYLVFPKFRVAVDMRTRAVLLADVHQWHANTPILGITGAYERISTVLYYREMMRECGTAQQERERAKNRKPGDPLRGKIEE